MFLFESVRRRAGYKLPRPATWLIRVLNLFGSRHVDTEIFPGVQVRLDLADDIQRCVFWQGETFEHPTPAILRSWCSENAEGFFDLGSNFGFYSYYILAACPNLSVYSFEPNPALYSQQMDAQTRNHINRFFPYNFGLGDADAILDLHISPADSGHSTFGPHPNWINPENKIRVQVTRFDDWMRNTGLSIPDHPSWVAKIDVEGYEVKVLRGMSQALQAHAFKGVCIEVNQFTLNFCGETSQTIYAVMKSFGYQAYDECMQIAEPQTDEFRNVFFVPA